MTNKNDETNLRRDNIITTTQITRENSRYNDDSEQQTQSQTIGEVKQKRMSKLFNSWQEESNNPKENCQYNQKQSIKNQPFSIQNKIKLYATLPKSKNKIKFADDSLGLTCLNKLHKTKKYENSISTIVYEKDEVEKKIKQKQNALKIKESLTKRYQSPKMKKKYLTLDKRHLKMVDQLYDMDNEYSLVWHENLLRKNHSRKFKVIGFINEVPTLGLQPLTSEEENEDLLFPIQQNPTQQNKEKSDIDDPNKTIQYKKIFKRFSAK